MQLRFDREVETAIYNALPHHMGKLIAARLSGAGRLHRRAPIRKSCARPALRLDAQLVGENFVMIEGGHLFPLEQPERAARLTREMIARLLGTRLERRQCWLNGKVDRDRAAFSRKIVPSPAFLKEPAMTIKSDKWIRRMAEATGMIEPFEPNQVREADGRKIISYGTSSYGYDIRCADEFKIFTNINSTIVDPKNFDSNSFVDIKSDVCIIPPNSFALARTIEYFRIPRNVLTVCLGKSTYARCGIIVNVTPVRAGMGRLCDAGVLEHHAAAGQDLRRRRLRAGAVLRER